MARLRSQQIDGRIARDNTKPACGILRPAALWPLKQGALECALHGLLADLQMTKANAPQHKGQNLAVALTVQLFQLQRIRFFCAASLLQGQSCFSLAARNTPASINTFNSR